MLRAARARELTLNLTKSLPQLCSELPLNTFQTILAAPLYRVYLALIIGVKGSARSHSASVASWPANCTYSNATY